MRTTWATAVLEVMVAAALIGWWEAGSMLMGSRQRPIGPPPAGREVVEVTLPGRQGVLVGWLGGVSGSARCVLLIHGMGGDRRGLAGRIPFYAQRGFRALSLDLQAHGESDGDSLTYGYLEQHDVTAGVHWLRERGCEHVVVNAFSMGAAAALLGAPDHRADAMIVEASFATLSDAAFRRVETLVGPLAALVTPLATVQLRPRLGFGVHDVRPVDAAARTAIPTLVIGGEHDPRAPASETQAITDALRGYREQWIVGGGENQKTHRFDPEGWETHVSRFLSRVDLSR